MWVLVKCMWFFVRGAGFMFVLQSVFAVVIEWAIDCLSVAPGSVSSPVEILAVLFMSSCIAAVLLYYATPSDESVSEWERRGELLGIIVVAAIGMFLRPLRAELSSPALEIIDQYGSWIYWALLLWLLIHAIETGITKLLGNAGEVTCPPAKSSIKVS